MELEKEHSKKWLSDDRNCGALSPDDEVWTKDIGFPRVRRAGWKQWAIVKPDKAVSVFNIQRFKELYIKQGLNVQFFTDLEEARTWLAHQ
jgi:hypothetical protein